MGERDWYQRYMTARDYADEQADAYRRGEKIEHWRQVSEHDLRRETLVGAAWVAWAYEIAASNATSLMCTEGKHFQSLVDECKRLAQEFQEKA